MTTIVVNYSKNNTSEKENFFFFAVRQYFDCRFFNVHKSTRHLNQTFNQSDVKHNNQNASPPS